MNKFNYHVNIIFIKTLNAFDTSPNVHHLIHVLNIEDHHQLNSQVLLNHTMFDNPKEVNRL